MVNSQNNGSTHKSQALSTASPALSLEHLPAPTAEKAHAYPSETVEEGFDVQRLFAILRRRRKVVGATVLASLALAGVYIALAPRVYQASADLLINSSKNSFSEFTDSPILAGLAGTGTRSQDTEVEILRSDSIQEAASNLLPLPSRQKLEKNVKVLIEPKRLTDVITVSVLSREPQLALVYSNAICDAYRLQNQKNNTENFSETAKYVGAQLERVRNKLDERRAELRNFKQENDFVDLPTESTARVARLSQLESDLEQAEIESSSGVAQLRKLRAQARQMAPAEIVPETFVISPEVQQLRADLIKLESQRLTTLQEYALTSPEVRELNTQIASVKRLLQSQAKTEVGVSKRNINPVREGVVQAIAQTEVGILAAQARAEALRRNLARVRDDVRLLPDREYRLSKLQADLATYQQTFLTLSDKYETLIISTKTPVANARIISAAKKAEKVSPRTSSTLVLALVGGLLLAVILAVGVDTLDNRIYTEEDAFQVTGVPVLTHVPMIKGETDKPVLIDAENSSALLESFRMLRTQLAVIAAYGHMKSLVLTSSQPGEGKSTVSANLAIALALNGSKVILLDADLRRPRVHTLFGIKNAPGLTTVVAGLCSIEDALRPTSIEGLQVMTSGATPPNPAELLGSRATRDVVEHLKTLVDYVIIDAPPALMIADAQIAATMADGVLLVISCQEAKRNAVERTCQLMEQTGVKMVGMVLNKFTAEQAGYYGYEYSSYDPYINPKKDPALEAENAIAKKDAK